MRAEVVYKMMPEEWELRKKEVELKYLEARLAQRELDLTTFYAELRIFHAHYLKILGGLYSKLDELTAQIAELESQSRPDDSEMRQKAAQARTQATESARAAGEAKQKPAYQFKPSDNIKKLYREVAKRIHPDLATDDKKRIQYQQLMAEANRAYEEGDEVRLQAILHQWESSPESVKGDGPGAMLIRVIRKIARVRERLHAIEEEMDQLKETPLFQLKMKVEEAERKGRNLLSEMAVFLTQQIARAREQLIILKLKIGAGRRVS
ncbi:MAG: J domain-containing protein [Firmicutes bacterium]|nr:J domain-containing protein [Bacillota bacterium]